MTSRLPCLDIDADPPARCWQVLHDAPAAHIRARSLPAAGQRLVLQQAAWFFAQPAAVKAALDIAGSPHHRGYSVMHNERDWREQIHIGRELAATATAPDPRSLHGPNRWPDDPAWRTAMLGYLAAVEAIGVRLLDQVAAALSLPPGTFATAGSAYLLMKLICYHAQPVAAESRPGVAAHVDFSWLTLTLQDDVGGLQVQGRDGTWCDVTPEPGTLLVHCGELLQFATRNQLTATPHRVVNPSRQRARLSIPVFVNPDLSATVAPLPCFMPAPCQDAGLAHVHRVLATSPAGGAFGFGEAEWRRKGENVWCRECVPSPVRD